MTRPERLDVYKGKKVLVTGHTGFKGSWLTLWLDYLGAQVCGYSPTAPSTGVLRDWAAGRNGSTHAGDVRDAEAVAAVMQDFQPDLVFHLAAHSVVAEGRQRPLDTIAVNVLGTAAVIDAARRAGRPVRVMAVSSDKCYAPVPADRGYGEEDRLGGIDVYSASKACAEVLVEAYRYSILPGTGVTLASTRAGNVIGGGDWTPGRLVPDIVQSAREGRPVVLRAPQGVRAWQHVLDALGGYLLLGAALLTDEPGTEGAWNFGPDPMMRATTAEVARKFSVAIGGRVELGGTPSSPTDARNLRIRSDKARIRLSWRPAWDLDTAIARTAAWYTAHGKGADAAELCLADIRDYEAEAAEVWR